MSKVKKSGGFKSRPKDRACARCGYTYHPVKFKNGDGDSTEFCVVCREVLLGSRRDAVVSRTDHSVMMSYGTESLADRLEKRRGR